MWWPELCFANIPILSRRPVVQGLEELPSASVVRIVLVVFWNWKWNSTFHDKSYLAKRTSIKSGRSYSSVYIIYIHVTCTNRWIMFEASVTLVLIFPGPPRVVFRTRLAPSSHRVSGAKITRDHEWNFELLPWHFMHEVFHNWIVADQLSLSSQHQLSWSGTCPAGASHLVLELSGQEPAMLLCQLLSDTVVTTGIISGYLWYFPGQPVVLFYRRWERLDLKASTSHCSYSECLTTY